ncbi:MAG: hypothetical protein AVDCRST_MAG67-604, partial [uncultured Solirubrobacteraceae bacterium]
VIPGSLRPPRDAAVRAHSGLAAGCEQRRRLRRARAPVRVDRPRRRDGRAARNPARGAAERAPRRATSRRPGGSRDARRRRLRHGDTAADRGLRPRHPL